MTATGVRGALRPFDQLESVAIRQTHVCEANIELVLAQQGLGAGNVHRGMGPDIHTPQRQAQQFTDIRLIVDNQRKWLAHFWS